MSNSEGVSSKRNQEAFEAKHFNKEVTEGKVNALS
jgi:hypothetical protein